MGPTDIIIQVTKILFFFLSKNPFGKQASRVRQPSSTRELYWNYMLVPTYLHQIKTLYGNAICVNSTDRSA